MRVAVVGHVEWVEFARVDRLPAAGAIVHARDVWEEAAGGGAVAAAELVRLGADTTLFTALGNDELGRRAESELAALGIALELQVRDERTRRAFTLVDADGERTIVVLGDKLVPHGPLALAEFDAVYFVSGDVSALRSARDAPALVATARELSTLRASDVRLDALVGSADDEGETYAAGELDPAPDVVVRTAGARGGTVEPGGPFESCPVSGTVRDAYGCGDCFAAAFTFALARGDDASGAAVFGARSGAAALARRGAHGD